MVSAIPHTVNKKQFVQLTADQAKTFYKKMAQQLVDLTAMMQEAKDNKIELPDLLQRLDRFTAQKPASLTRLIYETVVVSETHVLECQLFQKYVENYVL